MKKFYLSLILLIFIINAYGIDLIISGKNTPLDLSILSQFEKVKVNTHREKNGKVSDDAWEGYRLTDIFKYYQIEQFDLLEVNSIDNYQVKLSFEEIKEHQPILAIKRNDKALSENQLRIVASSLRDMYWASDIKNIIFTVKTEYPKSKKITPFSAVKRQIALIDDPTPFKNVKGYYFKDMIDLLNIDPELPLKVSTRDQLILELDYKQFLEKAVLIQNPDGSIDIKSPSMPGGMWQKNIGMIVVDDQMIYFDQSEQIYDEKQIKKECAIDDESRLLIHFDKLSEKELKKSEKKALMKNIQFIEVE